MSTKKTQYKLGISIKKARKEVGLSQKDLADHLHVSDKAVSSYEVGRSTPSFDMLKRISKIVHKPISYFDESVPKDDYDLQIKLATIEKELLEIKKILSKRKQ